MPRRRSNSPSDPPADQIDDDRMATRETPDLPGHDADDLPFDPLRPSKSALKRQMHALQDLGERLLALRPGGLDRLPLSESLRDAIAQYHRIRPGAREGRRRQAQLIGKLMRDEDTAAIAALLDTERDAHRAQGLTMQVAAQWRDRLVQGDPAEADAFEKAFGLPGELRELVGRARREFANDRPPQAQRLLFRRIMKRMSE